MEPAHALIGPGEVVGFAFRSATGQRPGAVMHNNLHEKLARLHRDDLMAAARQSRLRAIVRATRPEPRPGRQR